MNKPAGVELQNIVKEFKTHDGNDSFRAVDGVSVTMEGGKFVTLLGPSGCGKTTILRMIAGFEFPNSGTISVDGAVINDIPPERRNTAMVFQSYALFPHYNIFDNIAYGLKNKKFSAAVIQQKVKDILDLVGLDGLENRNPNQLSGGQQQRVALARSLVMEPSVLLFDEPLSNLDARLRIYMRKEIRKIQQRLGLTSIYVTHDQSEAMSLSDTIIVMNKGKIEQVGTPSEIYQRPASAFVASFIGTANFVPAWVMEVVGDVVTVDMWGQPVSVTVADPATFKPGSAVKVVVRPEAIHIGARGDWVGQVTSSTYMGAYQDYAVQIGDNSLMIEDANPLGKTIFAEGETAHLSFQKDSLHLICAD